VGLVEGRNWDPKTSDRQHEERESAYGGEKIGGEYFTGRRGSGGTGGEQPPSGRDVGRISKIMTSGEKRRE